jgi:uncharacterized protein (TIGR02246 family)
MKQILILVATLSLFACSNAPVVEPVKEPDQQADKEAINKLRDDFAAALNASDAAKIGELYAETAVVLSQGQHTLQGRAAIVDFKKKLFAQTTVKVTINSRAMNISGDLAFDEGTYTVEATPKNPANAKPVTQEVRYLVVLLRGMDGAWKIIEDIDNVSVAAAPSGGKAKD